MRDQNFNRRGEEIGEDDPRYIPDDMVTALREERSLLDPEMSDPEHARKIFLEHAPAAASTIAHIALHGTSERVRLDASKYVVERVLGRVGDDNGSTDPIRDFMDKFVKRTEAFANANGDMPGAAPGAQSPNEPYQQD